MQTGAFRHTCYWAALALTLLGAAACGSGKKNKTPTPTATLQAAASAAAIARTPVATATPALSAQQLVDAGVASTDALKSFHFILSHENGTTPIAAGIAMRRAEGDFVKPDRFRATVNGVLQQGFAADVQVINVGSMTWLAITKNKYAPLQNGVGAATILDPDNGVIKALKGVKNPQITGTDKINGVDTTVVAGTIDAGDLTALDQDAQAGKPVHGVMWIGVNDHRVYRLRIEGPLTDAEPANIVRQIDLSQFDMPFDIQPPTT